MVFVSWRLCINIYACVTRQITLHLVRLKMKSDKEHICHCFLFCFDQKKNATDPHRIICETYDENIIAIRTCANWFKRFKNDDYDISHFTKNAPQALQLWKRTNCGKMRKSREKR